MTEYRKGLPPIDPDKYWHVDMGPIPGLPDWHEQSKPVSYPFPTSKAAYRFALAHKQRDPGRSVVGRSPDGQIRELGEVGAHVA